MVSNRLGKIIRHVEQTEGMKFKKRPTFSYTNQGTENSPARNTVRRSVTGDNIKVTSARVQVNRKFARSYQQPFVDAIVAHELRENLYHQNGIDRRKNAPDIHRKAQRWINKDERWAKRVF